MQFNTKANLNPFLNKVNSSSGGAAGALAQAFQGLGKMFDSHGENADASLIANLKDSTSDADVKKEQFYNPFNVIKAEKLIEQNRDKQYRIEDRATLDAQNAQDIFTKEAMNDASVMTKDQWNEKYENAGGYDALKVGSVWDDKEDRTYVKKKRVEDEQDRKIRISREKNEQVYKNKQRDRENEKWDDYQNEKTKKTAGNKLLNDIYSGVIQTEEGLAHYADSVDPATFKEAKDVLKTEKFRKSATNITSKYTSWSDFKKSEDWKTAPYQVKDTLAKSKVWGKTDSKLTFDQKVKKEQIDIRKSELGSIMKEYKEKYNKDMSATEQASFVYENEKPKLLEEQDPVEKEMLPKKTFETLSGLMQYKNAGKEISENYDKSSIGWFDNAVHSVKNVLTEGDMKENTLHSAHANLKNMLIKLRSGSAVSAQEAERMLQELGSMSSSETMFKAGLKNFMNNVVEAVKAQKVIYDAGNYDTKPFDATIGMLEEMRSDISSLYGENNKKVDTKKVGKKSKEPTNTNNKKSFTASDLRAL